MLSQLIAQDLNLFRWVNVNPISAIKIMIIALYIDF